jgi:hypothetical protein
LQLPLLVGQPRGRFFDRAAEEQLIDLVQFDPARS